MTAMTDFSKDAKIFKALCDTKRLTILDYLKSGEKCACVLIENMNIGQSALSYHMKILCDSGIVNARQEGKWTHYSLSKSGSEYASKRLLELTTPNGVINLVQDTTKSQHFLPCNLHSNEFPLWWISRMCADFPVLIVYIFF